MIECRKARATGAKLTFIHKEKRAHKLTKQRNETNGSAYY